MDKEKTMDKAALDKETLLDWYRQMVLIRRVEQRSSELYQQGQIGGFLHLYIGQEAVAVGSIAVRGPEDHVITAYRDHGHALAVGISAEQVMAELLGKATGISKGKGGSMHLADVERRFWGGYAVVGGHLPLAAGIALAEQYKGTEGAVLCYMGDGATNIGYFHESLNLSGVWDLPVVWIVENNEYGMGTSVRRASAVADLTDKAKAYGMPAVRIDGHDIFEVYEATKEALDAIRDGGGPQYLEVLTYRYEGHSMGDPLRYRTREEVEERRQRDPITFLAQYLTENEVAGDDELDAIDEQVTEEVEAAVKFAEESPLPEPEALFEDIYAEEC